MTQQFKGALLLTDKQINKIRQSNSGMALYKALCATQLIEATPIIRAEVLKELGEAGRQVGRREVVDDFKGWLKDYWTGLGSYNIPLKDVRAKLKEWIE